MQEYKLYIHKGSRNLITELNNYTWKEGKEIAVDDYNHFWMGVVISYLIA